LAHFYVSRSGIVPRPERVWDPTGGHPFFFLLSKRRALIGGLRLLLLILIVFGTPFLPLCKFFMRGLPSPIHFRFHSNWVFFFLPSAIEYSGTDPSRLYFFIGGLENPFWPASPTVRTGSNGNNHDYDLSPFSDRLLYLCFQGADAVFEVKISFGVSPPSVAPSLIAFRSP